MWWTIAAFLIGHFIGFVTAALLAAGRDYEHPTDN